MRSPAKGIMAVIAAVLVIALLVFFLPKLTHVCDNCGDFILGTGYTANAVSNVLTSLGGQEDKILCRECAAKEHALAIAAGKSLEDFKRPLFEPSEEE